jgi:hypothetical protein
VKITKGNRAAVASALREGYQDAAQPGAPIPQHTKQVTAAKPGKAQMAKALKGCSL